MLNAMVDVKVLQAEIAMRVLLTQAWMHMENAFVPQDGLEPTVKQLLILHHVTLNVMDVLVQMQMSVCSV